MADSKLTALTEITAPALTDIMYLVATPGGTPAEKKLELTNLLKLINVDGWVPSGYTWVYASADDPTFTFTISGVDLTAKYYAGMRVKYTQSTGGTKYGIITKTAFSTNTTITIYGGTDYNLENETITAPYYSTAKAPAGFPLDPTKWTVEASDTSTRTQATPVQNTWYNMNASHTISIPIGAWRVSYRAALGVDDSSTQIGPNQVTLSTANNSESDVDFTSYNTLTAGNAAIALAGSLYSEKFLLLAAKTSYYLNARTKANGIDNLYLLGDNSKTIIRAVCAYL